MQFSEYTFVVVDDDVDDSFLTWRHIRKAGINNQFISVKKPEKLIEMLDDLTATGIPNDQLIILLDVNMPRQNGFDTLRNVRAHPIYYDTLVYMLSSSDEEADVSEAKSCGCNGYLVKPFAPDLFLNLIEKEICPETLAA